MPRKLVLIVLMMIAILHLPAPASAAQSETKTPIMWGVNNNGAFFKPEETAVLSKLPLKMVRWGGGFAEAGLANTLITKVFADVMHKQNIEPLQQVGMFNMSPEDAAGLVRYVNIENKAGLKYWTIGNEPELFQPLQKKDIDLNTYLKKWRDIAQAMLAVDPSLIIVGPDVSLQMAPLDKSSRAWQWFDAAIKANGDLINVVSFHFYLFGADMSVDAMIASPDGYAKSLAELRDYLRQTLKRDVPLMLTEVNLNSNRGVSGDKGSNSLFAGLWLAEICGISAQQGLAAIMPWTAVRNESLSLIDSANVPVPNYYAIQAFAGYGLPIAETSSSVDGVKAYASTTDNGILMVLVNRTARDVVVKLGTDVSLGADHPLQAGSVTLGAHSMTRLEFDAKGVFVAGTTYGQKENSSHAAPGAVTPGA